jgi:hypothetical protein
MQVQQGAIREAGPCFYTFDGPGERRHIEPINAGGAASRTRARSPSWERYFTSDRAQVAIAQMKAITCGLHVHQSCAGRLAERDFSVICYKVRLTCCRSMVPKRLVVRCGDTSRPARPLPFPAWFIACICATPRRDAPRRHGFCVLRLLMGSLLRVRRFDCDSCSG